MANKKITDLQLRDDVEDDLNFPSDDGIQSYRVTGAQILAYILGIGKVPTSSLNDNIVHALTAVTAKVDDYFFIADTSDSNKKKKALISDVVSPRHEICVDTGNGHGSTATKIRRFTNTRKSVGTAIVYADSAANGATFTIAEDGIYSMCYGDYRTGGVTFIGITVDASSLTTNSDSLSYAQGRRAGVNQSASLIAVEAVWTGFLSAGQVVRAHTKGDVDATDSFAYFTIVKVSN